MATTPYQDAYNAIIQSMYTAGVATGNQFQSISEQFTAAQFAQMAEQSQQLSYVQNLDESIRYFQITNPECQFALAPSTTGAGILNSNEKPATNTSKDTFTSTLASTTVLNMLDTVLSLGEVRKPAQTTAQKVLAFAGKSCLPIQIASVATMLGKQIDKSLYSLATQIGLHPPSALDPTTWNGLVSNDELYGQVFNWLLNIDPETNKLSVYTDLDSIAYSALWLKNQGFFDETTQDTAEYTPPASQSEYFQYYNQPLVLLSPDTIFEFGSQSGVLYRSIYFENAKYVIPIVGINSQDNIAFFQLFAFNDDTSNPIINYHKSSTSGDYEQTSNSTIYQTLNGTDFMCNSWSLMNDDLALGFMQKYPVNTYNNAETPSIIYTATIAFDGIISEGSSIPGVEPNGGTLPDTSQWVDVPSTKQSLINQYPDINSDPIVVDTVQPDGSTKQYTYVPTPLPADVDQLGNPDTQNIPATERDIDPNTATNPQLQMIIQLLTELQPLLAPQPQPEPTPEAPDVKPPVDGSNKTNPNYDGDSGTGTGIAIPPVTPTGNSSALWTVYNPSQSELDSFGGWLWSPAFIDNVLKLFSNPMDGIIGVHKIFAPVPTGGRKSIKCGFLDSGVSAATVPNQYTNIDCGSVDLNEYYGNVFDYDPHTKVSIYLPFIGVVPLKVAEVMRATIKVTYSIDIYTGTCLAQISVNRDAGAGGILYTYGGSCACYYPLSSGSYSGIISGVLSSAAGIGGALMSGNPVSAVAGVLGGLSKGSLHVQHSGGFTGPSGVMGPKTPYLIVERPQSRVANNVEYFNGIPSNEYTKIGDCTNYVKVEKVHLIINHAYTNEIKEIEELLLSGVLINDNDSISPSPDPEPTINIIPITITSNGVYHKSGLIDGYNPITVEVGPHLTTIDITENGIYTPDNYDGYSTVNVNVSGTSNIIYGSTIPDTTQGNNGDIYFKYTENGNIISSQYENLNNWTKNAAAFTQFDNTFENNENTLIQRGGSGYERIFINVAVTANTTYTFSLDYYSPSGVPSGYGGQLNIKASVASQSQMESSSQLSSYLGVTNLSRSTENDYTSYSLSFNSGNYTSVYLVIDLNITDNNQCTLKFKNISCMISGTTVGKIITDVYIKKNNIWENAIGSIID